MKILKSISQRLLLFLTPLLLVPYIMGLSEKIKNPTFKNLPTSNYVFIGVFLLVVIIIDLFTIRTFIKKKKINE